jgi:hypothetical protein
VEKEGKTGPLRQVRQQSSEACNEKRQLTYALLTHFDIMMDRFKNAFLMTSSVCRAEGPTGVRPPAALQHVLARSTTPDYL